MKKYSFPPIVNQNSKVLILGTMPGEKSLRMQQYYASPMNQFWKIIRYITGNEISANYEEKKKVLLQNNIAIWDVLMHCEREGSLDMNISEEYPNEFESFFTKYPKIKAVFFNGSKAEQLFTKHRLYYKDKTYITLPSTSSANTSMTLERKANVWEKEIGEFL